MKEKIKNAAKHLSIGGLGGVGIYFALLYSHIDKRTDASVALTDAKIKPIYELLQDRNQRFQRIEKRLDIMDKRLFEIFKLITKGR